MAKQDLRTNWGNNSFFTYLLMPPNFNPKNLEQQFPAFLDKHMADQYKGSKPSNFTKLGSSKVN